MTLLSINEMVQKTEKQRKDIEFLMDKNYYDFTEANLFHSPEADTIEHGALGKEDTANLRESLRAIPLREFMAKSGSTGIAGAAYLIPDKIHTTLFDAAVGPDIVDQISIAVITDIPGSSLKVDIGVDGSYKAWDVSSGGKFPDEEIAVTQATITPTLFGVSLRIANDMIEDQNWDLIDWHLRNAGAEIGDEASRKALTVLAASTDGDGTVNTVTSDTTDITHFITLMSAQRLVVADEWEPNTMVLTAEAFFNNIIQSASWPAYAQEFKDWFVRDAPHVPYGSPGRKILGMNTIFNNSPALRDAAQTSGYFTSCKTIVFDKAHALLTGRKRWLRIERYSDPIRDLVGAVVTSRQDSVSVYNDATAVITEA